MSVRSSAFRPAIVIGLLLLVALLPAYVATIAGSTPFDFSAFWCAGKAIVLHENPYLDSSVHQCQIAHGLVSSLTIPLPYPPYALAFFSLPALLPFEVATVAWRIALVVIAGLTAIALRRLAGISWPFAGALAALQLIAVLPLGQLATLPICAFAWSLVFIRERRTVPATVTLAVTALLPNFALAAWVAAFLTIPRQRLPLALVGAFLVAGSFLAAGAAGIATYVEISSSFAHAIGAWFAQVGTLPLLAAMKIPPAAATTIAFLLLIAAIAAGVVVGMRLRKKFNGDHWSVAAATAFSVVGAPYLHGWDIGFCLPLAVMLWAASPQRWQTSTALILIATPWVYLVEQGGVTAAIAIPFLLVAADAVIAFRLVYAAAAAACIVVVTLTLFKFANDAGAPAAVADARFRSPPIPANALADVRFDAFLRRPGPKRSGWYERIPTYVELIVFAIVTYRESEPG